MLLPIFYDESGARTGAASKLGGDGVPGSRSAVVGLHCLDGAAPGLETILTLVERGLIQASSGHRVNNLHLLGLLGRDIAS